MSQPQINTDLFSQSQTMFYTEGQTTAVLVTRNGEALQHTHHHFPTAHRAFAWCRKHRAGFVYMPTVPNN
jgi:hypothetical protein